MKYIIALTGGIGSGKSTVANIFSQFGIDIIDADTIAREILQPGTITLQTIIKHFTNNVMHANGMLNRRILREHIFSIPDDKDWLDNLCHPIIYHEIQRKTAITTSPYVVWVIPLLIETLLYKKVNRVLVIDVDVEKQIQRTMRRDNISRLHVEMIIAAQSTRENKLAISDDIIDNNGSLSNIWLNVAKLHTKYLRYAAK